MKNNEAWNLKNPNTNDENKMGCDEDKECQSPQNKIANQKNHQIWKKILRITPHPNENKRSCYEYY